MGHIIRMEEASQKKKFLTGNSTTQDQWGNQEQGGTMLSRQILGIRGWRRQVSMEATLSETRAQNGL